MVKFWYIPEKTQYIDSFRLHYSMKKAELSIFAAQKIHRFPGFFSGRFCGMRTGTDGEPGRMAEHGTAAEHHAEHGVGRGAGAEHAQ